MSSQPSHSFESFHHTTHGLQVFQNFVPARRLDYRKFDDQINKGYVAINNVYHTLGCSGISIYAQRHDLDIKLPGFTSSHVHRFQTIQYPQVPLYGKIVQAQGDFPSGRLFGQLFHIWKQSLFCLHPIAQQT